MIRQTQSLPAKVPDFFIVGSAKCGTTTLFHHLSQHPDVFLPTIDKEPGYYCDTWGTTDPDYYFGLFSGREPHQITGEASTPYLTCPASPALIASANPRAKIIILLRNPAERAFSLYLQMVKTGLEFLTPFEAALEAETSRAGLDPHSNLVPGYYFNYLYFESGRYEVQLRRYRENFPESQILVILFEDLVADLAGVKRNVFQFLGVEPIETHDEEIQNPARYPALVPAQFLIKHRLEDPSRRAGIFTGIRLARTLKNLNLRFGKVPRVSPRTYNSLVRRYAGSIEETSRMIGRDLSAWRIPRPE